MRFIYYNAISNVEPGSREAVGGIALFKSLCKYYQHDAKFQRQPKVMTLFNWDAFNPSLESSVTKGETSYLLQPGRAASADQVPQANIWCPQSTTSRLP